jgi:APA family basic amino acid/polyamine antiporter
VADAEHAPTAGRKFGYWPAFLVVVGSMIGAGILTTSGYTLRDTGNPAALLALWAVGGVVAVCGALTVAELATALPRSGGDYVFVTEGFGPAAGFVSGWATFTLGFAAPTAFIAHVAVGFLIVPFAGSLPEKVVPLGATVLIVGAAAVHTRGHRHSSRFQVLATLTTAVVLVALGVGGVLFGKGDWDHLSAGGWPTAGQWPHLAVGLIYVGYAYAGWNAAAYLGGEVRDPVRLLPRCLIGGAAAVTVLYLLVNLAYVYALDPAEMTRKGEAEVEQVADLAAAALFGRPAANLIAAALGVSLVGAVSAYLLAGPRVAFAMARDGAFPAFAGRLHPTRETPVAATLTQAAIAVGLVWSGSTKELLNYTSVGLAALSGLTVASVFPIRRRVDLPHPYRVPLYPLPPLAFLVLILWTVARFATHENPKQRDPALLSLGTLLLGVPLYWVVAGRAGRVNGRVDPPPDR